MSHFSKALASAVDEVMSGLDVSSADAREGVVVGLRAAGLSEEDVQRGAEDAMIAFWRATTKTGLKHMLRDYMRDAAEAKS